MPGPKHINSRRVWDRLKLDAAFSALPGDDGEPNPFDNIDLYLEPEEALERMDRAHSKAACAEHQVKDDWSVGRTDAEILRMFKIRDPRKQYKYNDGIDISTLPKRVQEVLKKEYLRRGYPWED